MTSNVRYWLKGESVQNFGDFLSEYLLQHLFYPQPNQERDLRIIGSCLDDGFVQASPLLHDEGSLDDIRPVFWGCGLRRENGLSLAGQKLVQILSVRGPLTHSSLRLDVTVPIGDPGLLLPAIYHATESQISSNTQLLVPHFHEQRSDKELLARTGCSKVYRPNVPNSLGAITDFIEQIVAADFILCGAMHAAVVAAAYGRPFAFWDSGKVDLPFKWHDFAASVSMPCVFHSELSAAQFHYKEAVQPVICIPVLWPVLAAAPLPVRPDALVNVIKMDIARHGSVAIESAMSARPAIQLHHQLTRKTAAAAIQARHYAEILSDTALLRERMAALTEQAEREQQRRHQDLETLKRLEAEHATAAEREVLLHAEHNRMLMTHAAVRETTAMLESDLGRLRVNLAGLVDENARLNVELKERDHALEATRAVAGAQEARMLEILSSHTWRVATALSYLGRRIPWASRLLMVLIRRSK